MPAVDDHEAVRKAAATPEPVEVAGRYRVIETLGSGGWGIVYKAWDNLLHRTVAIKAIRLERLVILGVHRDEVLRRFEREATTAAGLSHPGIVTIYDVGTWQGAPYLAMEFVEGVSLDRLLAREGRLSAERAALLALAVAEALEHAHGHGVLHRDVKPQNVIVLHERPAAVKLVDFGLAKAMDCTDHLTRTGTFLGTPAYASPEQLMGEVVDGRSDVWAVGCVLYEMLTGEKAFAGKGITSLIVQIMTVEPPPVRELDPAVPEELARIVRQAMAKAREERQAGATSLAADLRHFVRSHGAGQATPPPLEVAAVPREEAAPPPEEATEPMEATVIASAAGLGTAATTLSAAAPTVQVPRSPTVPRSPMAQVPRSPTVRVPRSARRQRRAVRLWPALGLAALVAVAAGLAAMRWVGSAARSPDASATVDETASAPAAETSTTPPVSTPPSLVPPPPTAAAPVASPPPPAAALVVRPGAPRAATRPRAAPPEETARSSSGPPGATVSRDGALPEPVAAAPDPNRVYAESEVDVRPQKLALRLPSHPERLVPALKRGEAISVTLALVVGVDGSVSDVKVDRSSGITAVDEAVTRALAGARFRAGEKGGVPVRTHVIFVFTFRGG